jgi:(1->4)-alpha-D-glucan 1-alpha-D-glucosylmutase
MKTFIASILQDREFLTDLIGFVDPLIGLGRINSLSQALLKLTSPGVPDIYQGNELWDMSLVDPDNRRAVDYATRRKLLSDLNDRTTPEDIIRRAEEGLPKLWVTKQALHLRRDRPELFGPEGAYDPIEAKGPKADHVVAFCRGGACVTVAPRLPIKLGGDWLDTTISLPSGDWKNLLTGEPVEGGEAKVGRLLGRFPVALLVREEK